MGGPNFELVSDLMRVWVRSDIALADKTLANPQNAVAIMDGEWLTYDSATKLVRPTDITSVNDEVGNNDHLLFPVWSERGRSDVQTIGQMPVIYQGVYEADTTIFDAAVDIGAGDPITAVGQPLKLATISLTTPTGSARLYTGIVGSLYNEAVPAPTHWVGYVVKLPANNGGKLRFYAKAR